MKLRNTIAAGLIAASATFGVATATAAEDTTSETAVTAETGADATAGTEAPATDADSSFGEAGSTDGIVSGSSEKLDALSSEVSVDSITGVFNTLGSLAQSILGLVTALVG